MSDGKKGRSPVEFGDAKIFDILRGIEQGTQTVSAYYIQRKFVDELGYVKIDLQKAVEGRGRRRKVYFLTESGKDFVKNYQLSSDSKD